MFEEPADVLLKKYENNPKMALQVALAYCSGHLKQSMPAKSLLNGRDNQITLEMSVDEGKRLDESAARAIIEKYWHLRVLNSIY